ncbi:type II secretion system F family protein [Candidatus Daviesbacteria bacterium]|nr:type II secretion system F family protein [Candidatus Daviesbacteria bacterium]
MNLNAQVQIFNRVTLLDKLLFTKHLSLMIKSGIPLSEAVTTIKDQTEKTVFKKVLDGVLKQLLNGQSLEKSLEKFPKVFDPLYLSLIRVGEESGELEKNLDYLSLQLKKDYEFRKKIQGAMLYPAIVFSATAIVGFSVSFFLLPQLATLFESLGSHLPLSTRILLFIANTMKSDGIFIAIIIAGLTIGFKVLIETSTFKPIWHKLLLKIPIFGPFLQNVQLAEFCRNLGTMLKSGLPINQALDIEYDATTNLVFKEYINKIKTSVSKGQFIEAILETTKYKYIPPIVAKMVGVGEKSGKLDETLLYLGDFFEEEVDDTTKNLSSILEPILLLVIGLAVAFVAMAIISPIYDLTNSIKR